MNNKKTILVLIGLMTLFLLVNTSFAAVKTFHVQETDLVKVKAEATDLDNDKIVYYYSPPLDDKGEWQTDYDDAGEHDLEITASDGVNQVKQEVKVIVDNKNQPPILSENKISIKETQTIDLKKLVTDPDDDPISFNFNAPFDNNGKWTPDYDNEGNFVTVFEASDGEFNEKFRVDVSVSNTNQAPEIINTFSEGKIVNFEEDEDLEFYVEAVDGDKEELSFVWKFDGEIVGEENSGEYYLDYNSAGEHLLELVVTDGTLSSEKEWTINIENVNRKPVLDVLSVTVKEGELVYLDLPDVDLDGDVLSYSFETPLDKEGEWQTNFNDAGKYNLELVASDGEFSVEKEVEIIVLDVDLAPVLNVPEKIYVNENEELLWEIDVSDPDNDKVEVSFAGFPEVFDFDKKDNTFSWTPSYDYIKRKGNFVSNLLSSLKLEHYFLKKKTVPFTITACGKELCTSNEVKLIVYNVNRMPQFTSFENLTITELDSVDFNAEAVDPDGDKVKIYYGWPLNKRSGKWSTDYDDQDIYPVTLTATDGKLSNTETVYLTVKKNNREPTLKIKKDKHIVNEGEEFSFWVSATDPDNDELKIRLDNIPFGASFNDGQFTWAPAHSTVAEKTGGFLNNLVSKYSSWNRKFNKEQETVFLSFVASDGSLEVVHPVEVIVKNVNQKPEVLDFLPEEVITVETGVKTVFHVAVKDLDNDKLSYEWNLGLRQQKVIGTDTITRTFTSPGKKKVKVVVSDGRDSVTKEWVVNVYSEVVEDAVVVDDSVEEQPFTVKVWVVEG
ncbi:hypothetical protein HOL59_04270 [Candidatus Woesearchaeota archaeon]|nr:hypothetical protein [Candidatus Woesearchaeota archaeon]